ncbi:hypothetical protein QBC38DRAFT_131496 [Podospora fimiseda]|uniref:Rhodopsin domain-containing protein n=1 Tax=Podospora fimiseda TaxID=252190 RepID=A0AAN7H145_9PEZI|nr:hypothetical protein QBC38DRAFT_131496 [Podospora fimiseda]
MKIKEYPTSSIQNVGISIIFIFFGFSSIVMGLRIYSKVRFKSFEIDDILSFLSYIFVLALTISSFHHLRLNYIGIPSFQIPEQRDTQKGLLWTWLSQIFYIPVLGLTQTSILFFLLKTQHEKTKLKCLLCLLIGIVLVGMIGFFGAVLGQCSPVDSFWKGKGECVNRGLLYLIQSGFNTLVGVLVFLIMPVSVVKKVKKLSTRRSRSKRGKRCVKGFWGCVFGLGVLVPIVSLIRLIFLYLGFYSETAETNPYWGISFILSSIEANLGIICSCAPTLWRLSRLWLGDDGNHDNAGTGGGVNGNGDQRSSSRTNQTWRYSTQRYGVTNRVGPVETPPIGGTGSSHVEAGQLGFVPAGEGERRLGLTPSEEEIMINYGVVTKGEGGIVQVVGSGGDDDIGYVGGNGDEIEEVGVQVGRRGRITRHRPRSRCSEDSN